MNKLHSPKIKGLFNLSIPLDQFINDIPIGIAVLDTERRLVLLNRTHQALSGFSQEEVTGIPCCHVLRSGLCVTGCPALSLDEKSEPVCMETDLINRDRQKIPIRITIAPLTDSKGNIAGFLETTEDMRHIREMDARMTQAYSFAQIVGKSRQMEKVFQILPVIAQSDSSVLITGETGTGKDMVAEAIHQASERAKGPFVKVNCGALPETLLESELFGHQKGAFTGAVENKPGRFRLAHNGTLFLTEIGDLPLSLQVKLLTFLDDKMVFPLGSTKGFQADVRVIAATHRHLEQMVRDKHFREDLLFRLNVVRLHLPALREREDDIRLLLDYFFNTLKNRFRKNIKGFSNNALKILKNYKYPGNVRELRNIVEYAANICQDEQIQPDHLPAYLTEAEPFVKDSETSEHHKPPNDTGPVHPDSSSHKGYGPDQTWSSVERKMIMDALVKAGGRRSKAAEIMGWGRSTLWRKMKQYGID